MLLVLVLGLVLTLWDSGHASGQWSSSGHLGFWGRIIGRIPWQPFAQAPPPFDNMCGESAMEFAAVQLTAGVVAGAATMTAGAVARAAALASRGDHAHDLPHLVRSLKRQNKMGQVAT